MKAISIKQPWAWAILHAGKDVENRTWAHNYRGPILIHTGKRFDHEGFEWIGESFAFDTPREHEFQMGGIVGIVTIKKMVRSLKFSPWMFGPWGWVLEDPKSLPFFPCNGQKRIFNVEYPSENRNSNNKP